MDERERARRKEYAENMTMKIISIVQVILNIDSEQGGDVYKTIAKKTQLADWLAGRLLGWLAS